jgi:hypothetical protein
MSTVSQWRLAGDWFDIFAAMPGLASPRSHAHPGIVGEQSTSQAPREG